MSTCWRPQQCQLVSTILLGLFLVNVLILILSSRATRRFPSFSRSSAVHEAMKFPDAAESVNESVSINSNSSRPSDSDVSPASDLRIASPPSEAAIFVMPSPTRHSTIMNINKQRVVLPYFENVDSPPPIGIKPRTTSSSGVRASPLISFFVIGDYGAANRTGQRNVSQAMNRIASGDDAPSSCLHHHAKEDDHFLQPPFAGARKAEYIAHKHNSEYQQRLVHEAVSTFQRTFNRPGGSHLDFIVSTGDTIYESGVVNEFDRRWHTNIEAVYSTQPCIRDKIWLATLGNHDQASHGIFRDVSGFLRRTLVSPRRNFWAPSSFYFQEFFYDHQPVQQAVSLIIVVLNTYDISGHLTKIRRSQILWLDSVLRNTRCTHRIVVGHRPIFSAGVKHGSSKYMERLLMPIFERHNVSIYFSGDDHALQLLQHNQGGMRFVVSGAGSRLDGLRPTGVKNKTLFQAHKLGFVAVEVGPAEIMLRFHDSNGAVLFENKR